MYSLARVVALIALLASFTATASAQDPPPRIGPFVVDLRGVLPRFGDDPALADSRGLQQLELPGVGLGASGGVHVYLPKFLGLTIGLGAEAMIGRSHAEPATIVDPITGLPSPLTLRPVTETFKSFTPQLSLNFGHGNGWSYLSLGIGRSIWSVTADGTPPLPADEEVLNTFNYGGGARWFIKKHLAFSLDVHLYDIGNGTPQFGYPGSPRTVMFVAGAGIAVR